ncbi:phosphate ABC transporter substrate-binding protein PstS [Jatrophihabitans sp. YIM 134969]
MTHRISFLRRAAMLAAVVGLTATASLVGLASAPPAAAVAYAPINGSGSSWSANAISNWTSNGKKFGWQVNYAATGSGRGRVDFLNNQTDFAGSDIPFQFNPTDGSRPEQPAAGTYAYMPIVAGGTSFMYNLKIGGRQVTNLRLSGQNIARIFAGQVKTWNDAAIAADNPGLTLPGTKVVPVIRSDSSGSSAQFSLWMQAQYPSIWRQAYPKGGETSYWPQVPGSQAKGGDDGVANFVRQPYGEGSIGYVQYSYAKNARFPVVKMLNAAGYYVEPTPQAVAVSLTRAKINNDPKDLATYLTQNLTDVYTFTDRRVYPLSSYSYMILRLNKTDQWSQLKANTLGAFGQYLLCNGQTAMPDLGYSPLPKNLVEAAFAQLRRAPGVNVASFDITKCQNPTFQGGRNVLLETAPQPQACDKQGSTQCTTGTGGNTNPTQVKSSARGNSGSSGGTTGGGTTGGGSSGGGTGTTSGPGTTGTTGGGTAAGGGDTTSVDPDTGLPQGGDGSSGGGAAEVPLAGPVSLNSSDSGSSGWSSSALLAVLAGALVLLVFVVPPLLMSRLSRRDGDSS